MTARDSIIFYLNNFLFGLAVDYKIQWVHSKNKLTFNVRSKKLFFFLRNHRVNLKFDFFFKFQIHFCNFYSIEIFILFLFYRDLLAIFILQRILDPLSAIFLFFWQFFYSNFRSTFSNFLFYSFFAICKNASTRILSACLQVLMVLRRVDDTFPNKVAK